MKISQKSDSSKERLAEEVRSLVINAALDAIIFTDTKGVITVWNKQAEKIFGWKQAEVLGRTLRDTIIPESHREQYETGLNDYLESGESSLFNQIIEITALNRERREFPVEFSVTTIKQNGTEFFCAFIRDITERKKAEFEILKANERFNLIARATNDIVWDWNLNTNEIFWNENFFLIFGYDPEISPSTAESWRRGIHPEDKARILTEIQNAITEHRQFWSGEYRFLSADGTPRFVFDRGFIQYDHQDKPVRMLGAMIDITERKKAEAKLVESENRLRTIIQTEPECIKLIGPNFELLEMNPAGLAMIEAENIEQVLGHSVLGLILPEHRQLFMDRVKDVFNGKPAAMKFEITGLKGSQRWIETHMVPMRNAGGAITSLLGVARDITEQKKNEESLRKAEEQFRHIFENTLEGIYQSTPGGRFITANTSMAKMFGFDSAQEMIASVTDIASEMYADPKDRLMMKEQVEKHGQANGFELRVLKKNKEMIWVRANIRVISDSKGKVRYYEGTIEDITERKVAEEKLKVQFEEIQKTNYELDRFVYSVSHDLRAPLSSILGIINIAEMEEVSPTVKEYLGMVRSSVNRLDKFIKDILNYSRNSRMEIRFEKINFRDVITETLNNLKQIEGADHLKVDVDVDDKLDFYSDNARLGIIFGNLFSNSIKYQDFTKNSSFLRVSIITLPEKAVITLSDNGIGIAKDHLDKIFNMFYRASDVSKGSGLGLYIAKETVSKLGGSMSVQSEFGIFTKFEITISNCKLSV